MAQPPLYTSFPQSKGTYILVLHLSTSTRLTVGKLGDFAFCAGWYGYVGSALGSGGLRGRLKHHLSPVAKLHWHIDYLRTAAVLQQVWYVASETAYEHAWANALRSLPGATVPAPRFGASDCKCISHLVYSPQMPSLDRIRAITHPSLVRWRCP